MPNKLAEIPSPFLSNLLNKYLPLRSNERGNRSGYGKKKGATDNLKAVSQAIFYLNTKGLITLEDLDNSLHGLNKKAKPISAEMKKVKRRMQTITGIQKMVADCKLKHLMTNILKPGGKPNKQHLRNLTRTSWINSNKAYRFLKKHGVDLNVNLDVLQAEYDKLKSSHAELSRQLSAVNEELKPMKDIRPLSEQSYLAGAVED